MSNSLITTPSLSFKVTHGTVDTQEGLSPSFAHVEMQALRLSALHRHARDFRLLNYCSAKDALNCFVLKEYLSRWGTPGRFVMFGLWKRVPVCDNECVICMCAV